jgi:hypothetical protein
MIPIFILSQAYYQHFFFNMSNDILCIANLFELIIRNEVRYHIGQSVINTSLSVKRARDYYSHSEENRIREIVREGEQLEGDRKKLKHISSSKDEIATSLAHAIAAFQKIEVDSSNINNNNGSSSTQGSCNNSSSGNSPVTGERRELERLGLENSSYSHNTANVIEQVQEVNKVYKFDDDSDDEVVEEVKSEEDMNEEDDIDQDEVDMYRRVVASRNIYSFWVGDFRFRATYSSQLSIYYDQDDLWFVFSDFVHDMFTGAPQSSVIQSGMSRIPMKRTF